MHRSDNHVRPIRKHTKAEVSGALAAGWARSSAGRKGTFADNLEVDVKTVNRALTGETTPELHTALNSLADDPTALDDVFALYSLSINRRASAGLADGMNLAAGLGHTLSDLIDRLRDGVLCHQDKLALAALFRPVIPQMQALVDEADALRGVAVVDLDRRDERALREAEFALDLLPARAAGGDLDLRVREVKAPDFERTVKTLKNDVVPAKSAAASEMQAVGEGYKHIKKVCHVRPDAARAALKAFEMEDAMQETYLRGFVGTFNELMGREVLTYKGDDLVDRAHDLATLADDDEDFEASPEELAAQKPRADAAAKKAVQAEAALH